MKRREPRPGRELEQWLEKLEDAKRYLRYCRQYTTERNARNYTRSRYRLSFDVIGRLVEEIEREDNNENK